MDRLKSVQIGPRGGGGGGGGHLNFYPAPGRPIWGLKTGSPDMHDFLKPKTQEDAYVAQFDLCYVQIDFLKPKTQGGRLRGTV